MKVKRQLPQQHTPKKWALLCLLGADMRLAQFSSTPKHQPGIFFFNFTSFVMKAAVGTPCARALQTCPRWNVLIKRNISLWTLLET